MVGIFTYAALSPSPLERERAARRAERELARRLGLERIDEQQESIRSASKIRRIELELEERVKRLAATQGSSPGKILIAELEVAEKQAELEYANRSDDMTDEERQVFLSKLEALRRQIQEERRA